jgi:uncharacterized protein (TIGR02594 family)
MPLPNSYAHLADRKVLPKMLQVALDLHGVTEVPGPKSNKFILDMAKKLKIDYKADSIPWCGLFMAYVAAEAGYDYPNWPLAALNWKTFGMYPENNQPMLGDVCVFKRDGGGHVGLYVGEDSDCYHILGGNQSNMVSIVRIDKMRLVRARRPIFKIGAPASVKKYLVAVNGKEPVSKNEA